MAHPKEADEEEAGGWLHGGVPPLVGRHHCSSPFLLFSQSIINLYGEGNKGIMARGMFGGNHLVFYGSESPW